MNKNCERCGGGIRPDVLKTLRGKHYHAICEPLDASPAEIAATEAAMAQVRETWPKEDTATFFSKPILRPCIFCGHEEPVSGSSIMQIHCPNCLALGPAGKTADEAAALWNRRDVQLGDLPPGYDDHCGCVDEPGSYGRRCLVCAESANVATRLMDRCLLEEIDELAGALFMLAGDYIGDGTWNTGTAGNPFQSWDKDHCVPLSHVRAIRALAAAGRLVIVSEDESYLVAHEPDEVEAEADEDREQLEGFNCSAGFCGGLGQ